MPSSGWFSFAAVLVVVALAVTITGASVTSSVTNSAPSGASSYANAHSTVAWIAGMLAVVLALVIVATGGNAVTRRVAFAAAGVFAVGAILGMASLRGAPVGARIAHACVAPVFLSLAVVLAVMGGKAWKQGPELVQDYGWPSMRSMGVATPVLVMLQIVMGAAFRHQAMGVMPHIVGAMLVALFAMIAGVCAMHQFPAHRTLRPTAVALMVVTGVQVFLGMTAFIMRMMTDGMTPLLLSATVAHVATGGLTLAAGTVLMVQIRRNVTPKPRG
jgi:hypothetical protein